MVALDNGSGKVISKQNVLVSENYMIELSPELKYVYVLIIEADSGFLSKRVLIIN